MPHLRTDDGVDLYYEETGSGTPLIFVHEFGGDHRSFEPQVRYFSRAFRCITFNARGYPPSGVPGDVASYSQDRAVNDMRDVLDGLGIQRAHAVGVSMGGSAVLHFGLCYPDRAISLVLAGTGAGSVPTSRQRFQEEGEAMASLIEREGMQAAARVIASGPTRVQHRHKDPRGWEAFLEMLTEHSPEGSARTLRGVQKARGSIYDEEDRLKELQLPVLIMVGDEDEGCLDPSLLMKRSIPASGLVVLPKTGHNLNLEEPALFNAACEEFFFRVAMGRWGRREAPMVPGSFLGLGRS
jgi:pimeloyl-ACP methyl ester carboxylesterase